MGANSSSISDLPKNEYLKKLSGTESISENDPFWNQLFSFSFPAPTSSTELKLLEEATVSVCKSLVENNPRTGNLGALTKVFLSRTRELRLSAECQNHIFIWQTHNALFIICCLLKVFICEMSEEELQLHFMYEEKSPGSYTGLWTVFTLGGTSSKAAASPELTSPLANQSLLLLLVLVNLTDAPDTPNPYRQAVTSFKNTQDSSPVPSSIPHAFQINFNSLYTALCEQQASDQATLLLYTLLHQNSNVRTYMLARTDMENLVLPILEILYHVEERNSHHVYMALIILLILTEDDGFNRSIHEVILKNITWYSERVLTEISLGSLLILVVIRTIQYNMTRTRDKYLHTNCLAALANMSAQFRSLHQYAAQRIIRACFPAVRSTLFLDSWPLPPAGVWPAITAVTRKLHHHPSLFSEKIVELEVEARVVRIERTHFLPNVGPRKEGEMFVLETWLPVLPVPVGL
ncbi:Dym [Phodopus roborovskii]|uniref:Dymeclin n=1 Tax=Phodopus roborovskii TaxID=109678 RepID=A0AAU9ZZN9_PHORO|nr:Dym [Phodopus roborovskii]